MTLSPMSIGLDRCGTPACLPLGRGLARAAGPGRAPSRRGAPHTMPPAIRKTAVLTKRPGVIEVYPRSAGAPMPLPHPRDD